MSKLLKMAEVFVSRNPLEDGNPLPFAHLWFYFFRKLKLASKSYKLTSENISGSTEKNTWEKLDEVFMAVKKLYF